MKYYIYGDMLDMLGNWQKNYFWEEKSYERNPGTCFIENVI